MRGERRTLAARAVPLLLLASTAAKSVKPAVKKEPPPVLNPFFEGLLKWWCETMDNEADSRCNLLFTHRHISQTSDGTQIRGLSAQLRRYVPMSGTAQRDQFEQLAADYCKSAEARREISCKKPDAWLLPVLRGSQPYKNPNPHAAAPTIASSRPPPPPRPSATAFRDAPAIASVLGRASTAAANSTSGPHEHGAVAAGQAAPPTAAPPTAAAPPTTPPTATPPPNGLASAKRHRQA